ncbi:inositol transport system substrate-binding protein [Lachnospiraceae bacterium]|nr:inositol transport system substrate-binding protein [Lachnospiraceae bacterium]
MNNNLITKILSVLLVCVLTGALIAGCGSSGGASAGNIKILYTIDNNDDTFRAALVESMQSTAKAKGYTLDVKLCGADVQNQVNDIKNAASSGYNAIICRPNDASTALQLEAATTLPIVFVNNSPSIDVLKADKYVFAGSNEGDAGTMQAEYILKKLGNKPSLNIIIIMGDKGHSAAVGRTKALKYALQDSGIDYNIVFSDYGTGWNEEAAERLMEAFFKTEQSVDAIFCNNDSLALGAIKSMKAHNIDPASIPVCGVDATAEGCASIAAGEMSFTVLQSAKGQGESAVNAAALMAQGKSLSSLEWITKDHRNVFVPFEPVDASNVKKYQ